MLKIRRPLGRLIFNMGIAIPGKTVFLIETAIRFQRAKDSAYLALANYMYCGYFGETWPMQMIPVCKQNGGPVVLLAASRGVVNNLQPHTPNLGAHYDDVTMSLMASQITSLTVVYSTVYSDADQRKHQSSASLAFVWGIHRDRWIPRTKGQLRGICFHLMTSSWILGKFSHRASPVRYL